MNIMPSTQVATGKYWVFERDAYALGGIRRHEMITNLRNDSQMSQGLSVSSRFGLAYKDAQRVMVMTPA